MTAAVQGDAGTCSTAGGSLLRAATRMNQEALTVAAVSSDLSEHWSGRAAVRARERATRLADGLQAAAEVLERVGRALQDHASDLADAVARVHAIESTADTAGLRVVDRRVLPAWGVVGEADRVGEVRREELRARLQRDLDLALLQVDRRRRRLAATAEAGRQRLADVSSALRR